MGRSASEAASLVFRIATVGLSLASAIMTAASTQCVYRDNDNGGVPAAAGTVSYADYASFRYSAAADLLSAVLQGVAIYLQATSKDGRAARAVELIDKLVQALTATSAALLLAVDDITSCGGPPRGGGGGRGRQPRQSGGLCAGQAGGAFCGHVRVSSAFSIAATVSVSASVYTRHAPVAAILAPPPPSVTNVNNVNDDVVRREEAEEKKCKGGVELIVPVPEKKTTEEGNMKEEEKKQKGQEQVKKDDEADKGECCWSTVHIQDCTPPAPATMPPPWCRCPRLTIPCDCEDPELCGAFF